MANEHDKPNAVALTYLAEAERALGVYKAIADEFRDKDLPAEKKLEMDRAYEDFERLDARGREAIETAQKAAKGAEFETYKSSLITSAGRIPVGAGMPAGDDDDPEKAPAIVYKAHRAKLGDAPASFTPAQGLTENWTAKAEAKFTSAFRRCVIQGGAMRPEDHDLFRQKALSAGVDTAGGFWVVPEVFATEFLATLADEVMMRRLATVMPAVPRGSSLSIRTGAAMDAAEWTTEIGSATLDTSLPAGQRSLTPHPLAKAVLVSNTLLEGAATNAESYVRGQIAELFEAAEEAAGMTGSGAGRWEGIFVSALPTDVTCTSATVIAYADLLEVEGALKAQYQRNASWIMHRTIRKELMSLVDGHGLPLLRRDPAALARFDLFGYPINISEYSPSSSATGLYVAALADWKRAYRIVDSLAIRVARASELHIASDQTGFYARKESDGMVVDGNGIVRLKMA